MASSPSNASLFFNGSKRDPAFGGAYLRTADDPSEPVATLSAPPRAAACRGPSTPATSTKRGPTGAIRSAAEANWFHVAVVNDGTSSIMYVDGAEVLRKPRAANVGLSTTDEFWLVGATHYDRVVEQSFYGWLGDVRIVDRPLRADEFMTSRE